MIFESSYEPEGEYSAVPTTIATNASGTGIYVAGLVQPPPSVAGYSVTLALDTTGKRMWLARHDFADPASIGVEFLGGPSTPVGLVSSRGQVFESVAYYPVDAFATRAVCDLADSGKPQPC